MNDGEISLKEYLEMYRKVVMKMPEIDEERRLKELGIDRSKKIDDVDNNDAPDLSEH